MVLLISGQSALQFDFPSVGKLVTHLDLLSAIKSKSKLVFVRIFINLDDLVWELRYYHGNVCVTSEMCQQDGDLMGPNGDFVGDTQSMIWK